MNFTPGDDCTRDLKQKTFWYLFNILKTSMNEEWIRSKAMQKTLFLDLYQPTHHHLK